ncbi:MAG: 5-formyltetrahydrofolate cyclo-ligase [Coriobacteriia bacterium]|nr:5-formyltetrahydrofolate cyclo-ligase [Coriobacteriia bacterium]
MRSKDDLRRVAREARASLSPARRQAAAASAAEQLLALPELRAARCVLVYAPLADELDPLGWIGVGGDCDKGSGTLSPQLVWPRVADRAGARLTLHACAESDLVPGSFGLREPRADAPQVALADIDVVLVPGLAFDRAGYRVGYGKGYYDRLLADAPAALLTIGLCFEETLFPEIEHEAHDVSVARVLVA